MTEEIEKMIAHHGRHAPEFAAKAMNHRGMQRHDGA